MDIDRINEGAQLIKDGMALLGHGPLDYYLKRLTACYNLLLTLAPYKVGDRVRLTRTPEISNTKSWGWMCGKHFLVTGAIATVSSVSSDGTGFDYGLTFDEDSWMESFTGKIHPLEPSERKAFCFTADWFERVNAQTVCE